jgi:hypothetical protein
MQNPLRLLELIANHTNRLYLWTHYYDGEIIGNDPNLNSRFQGNESVQVGSSTITLYPQFYKAALKDKAYCGGSEVSSKWLTRDGLLTALKEYGFTDFDFSFETPNHPNGPCLSLVAKK